MNTTKKTSIDIFFESWHLFFAAVSACLFALVFISGVIDDFFRQPQVKPARQVVQEEVILALIENSHTKEEDPKKKEIRFLSKMTVDSSGKLTNKKGYSADTSGQKLQLSAQQSQGTQSQTQSGGNKSSISNKQFVQEILDDEESEVKIYIASSQASQAKSSGTMIARDQKTEIPFYYNKQDAFVFSYHQDHKINVPTIHFQHYDYFNKMWQKIKYHWSPPGGQPYPLYGDSYHRMSPVPGRVTYQSIPSQNIEFYFMLDANGQVIEAKIHHSLGYRALDQSVLDAVFRSENFGPPPKELIENGYLVIPVDLRIH